MKILQVCQSFYPCFASGGVVRVAYEISKELVSMEHEVTVYTTDDCSEVTGDNKHSKKVEGINVYYFKNLSQKLQSKFKIANPYYIPLVARKEIKNFDVIHIHEHRTFLAVVVHHYAKKYGVPYIVQAHGSVLPFFQKILSKKIFDKIWGYNILNDASKVIALTETESKQYQKMGVPKDKIEIVPNGINLSEYQNIPARGEFRKKYGIKNDEKIILYLGRIHKRKGIDVLIKSFADVSKDLKNVKLVLVGPDDGFMDFTLKMLKELKLEDKVQFTGPLYNKDKLKAYIDSDILAYPAIYEIFGLVPFEAILCGTPVVVSDDCGCGELIKTANCGFLVKYGDSNDLSIKIKHIIENPKESYEKVQKGKGYILNNLIWDKIVKKVEKLYETCLDE